MWRSVVMALCILSVACSCVGTASAINYKVTDLGLTCPSYTTVYGSFPLSVNNSGQVVGYVSVSTATNGSDRRAAYYSAGSWTDIGDSLNPGNGITSGNGRPSMANGINNAGQVSGWYGPANLVNGVPYVYQIGAGTFTYLTNVPGVLNYTTDSYSAQHAVTGGVFGDGLWKKWTAGGGLNNSGQFVGYYFDAGGTLHKFKYDGSSTSEITTSAYSEAISNAANCADAISDSGVIVTHEDLWVDTHMPPPLQGLGWYYDAGGVIHSLSVNTPVAVAGSYVAGSSSPNPFIDGLGQITTLAGSATTLKLGSDTWSLATGVTSAGVAVGLSGTSSGAPSVQKTVDAAQHAFVYDGSATTDLNSLVVGSNPFSNLQAATSISGNGNYIVGYGPVGGTMHGFLLLAITPSTTLSGDATLDGTVNASDMSRVLTNYDKTGLTWADGDFNADGTANLSDLSNVLTNYDKSVGASAGGVKAVPEPTSIVLLVVAVVGLSVYARRKRK